VCSWKTSAFGVDTVDEPHGALRRDRWSGEGQSPVLFLVMRS